MGALTATGLTPLRTPFEPLTPGGVHVPSTNSYRWQEERDPLWAADAIEEAIAFEGPETIAAVILEPVQNGGGCFVPQDGYFQRVREICDRHGVLLIADEVICSWGRLGYWFGCERYGYVPDMITTAKGITSAYAPLGAVIAADHIAEPFLHGKAIFNHGFTFGGHPVACAVALANIDVIEREDLCDRVLANERPFREMLEGLRDLPIVGDVRGAGYFHTIELVKDKDTKETFNDEESEDLLRGFLSGELYRRGLICRTDDRGDPIAGLGFGTGFAHKRLPAPLVAAARKRNFPLFEVPYELPFIAITERAFAQLVNERYEILQRNMAGDVLAEALAGHLYPEDLQARLRPFGIGEHVAVLAFSLADPSAAAATLEGALEAEQVRSLVAIRGGLLCAVIDALEEDPIELARKLRLELAARFGEVRAAASRAA